MVVVFSTLSILIVCILSIESRIGRSLIGAVSFSVTYSVASTMNMLV